MGCVLFLYLVAPIAHGHMVRHTFRTGGGEGGTPRLAIAELLVKLLLHFYLCFFRLTSSAGYAAYTSQLLS